MRRKVVSVRRWWARYQAGKYVPLEIALDNPRLERKLKAINAQLEFPTFYFRRNRVAS